MAELTTLAAVKTWQSGTAATNTTGDANLLSLITSTSADFLREIQRVDLLENAYTENRIGDGSNRVILRHWPVQAVTSLQIATLAVPQQGAGTAGWYLDTDADPERQYVLYLANGTFTDAAPVSVTYIAGYASVPDDIGQAVTEWVVYRYRSKASTGQTQSRGVEGERNEFSQEAIPPNTQRVIEAYLRRWPSFGRGNNVSEAPAQEAAASQPSKGRGGRR